MRKCRVALKFCGCCNPYVDLSRIARHLRTVAESSSDFEVVSPASGNAEVVVILCGCFRACADRVENRTGRVATVVVAGESVNGEPVQESDVTVTVGQRLAGALDRWKRHCSRCS